MKQNANNFKFRVLPLKLDPNWDQIGIPSTYVKKVVLLLKLPLPVKVLKLGIRLPVTEGEVLLWVSLAKREEKHLCQSIFQLQVVMSLPKVCTKYEKHQGYSSLETVKESRKIWNFHFDLQLVPAVPNGTFIYCQEAGVISKRLKTSNV